VRIRSFRGSGGRASWLLIKHRDEFATKRDVTLAEPLSAISKRTLAEIARDGGGNAELAASGDPRYARTSR